MKNYKVGQTVTFSNGNKGEVISIGTRGNGDIRPPYHKKGHPTIKGIDFVGYVSIIPNEWEKLYGDEVPENELQAN